MGTEESGDWAQSSSPLLSSISEKGRSRRRMSDRSSQLFKDYFLCALQKKRLIYQGKLEVYGDRLLFVSAMFGGITEVYIPKEIAKIEKRPINSIVIQLRSQDLPESVLINFANRPRAMNTIRNTFGYFEDDVDRPKGTVPYGHSSASPGAVLLDEEPQSASEMELVGSCESMRSMRETIAELYGEEIIDAEWSRQGKWETTVQGRTVAMDIIEYVDELDESRLLVAGKGFFGEMEGLIVVTSEEVAASSNDRAVATLKADVLVASDSGASEMRTEVLRNLRQLFKERTQKLTATNVEVLTASTDTPEAIPKAAVDAGSPDPWCPPENSALEDREDEPADRLHEDSVKRRPQHSVSIQEPSKPTHRSMHSTMTEGFLSASSGEDTEPPGHNISSVSSAHFATPAASMMTPADDGPKDDAVEQSSLLATMASEPMAVEKVPYIERTSPKTLSPVVAAVREAPVAVTKAPEKPESGVQIVRTVLMSPVTVYVNSGMLLLLLFVLLTLLLRLNFLVSAQRQLLIQVSAKY